ncbi:winged helix-turn-helix domain-containing protein [Labilibacter marinus]|uniref:winged helix-turn-helix domain-containing protein n=1 Tax=Labilibacter marinus TaxID=1477105 RepID=UPI00094FE1DB|nr:LysR family transcriptional regulator [Labilibacter marinus]
MAGSKGSKYYDIFLDYSIQLNHKKTGEIMNSLHFALLNAIEDIGSIKEAAEHMGISYRKAWGIIQKMEEELGFSVVNRQRGGSHGGKTTLTEDGIKLIHAYSGLREEFDKSIHDMTKKFFQELNH